MSTHPTSCMHADEQGVSGSGISITGAMLFASELSNRLLRSDICCVVGTSGRPICFELQKGSVL